MWLVESYLGDLGFLILGSVFFWVFKLGEMEEFFFGRFLAFWDFRGFGLVLGGVEGRVLG